MIKKILLVFLIVPLILFCGFKKKERPFLILSAGTINAENVQRIERAFLVGQRVNYALVSPDGLKYSGVRRQLSTQSDKTTNYGFSLIETEDLYIDKYYTKKLEYNRILKSRLHL